MTTIFNVLDFGAKGDGVSDDTHAIQLAINAAFKAGGGEVYLPEGTFIISGANAEDACLTLKSNVTLTGESQHLTTLKLKDGSTGDIDAMVRTSSVHDTAGATLTRLTLHGNQAHTDGIVNGFVTGAEEGSPSHASAITVNQVTFTGLSGDGLQALAQTAGLIVEDSLASGNLGDGFATHAFGKGTAGFYDNEASDNGGDGFDLQYQGNRFGLYSNVAHDNAGNGMVLEDGASTVGKASLGGDISGGAIYGNGGAGLVERVFLRGYIRDMDIHDNTGAGVRLEGTRYATVTDSWMYNNGQNGDAQIVATGNTLANGQVVNADKQLTLTYNNLVGNGSSAAAVMDTDTNTPQYHYIYSNVLQNLAGGIDVAGNMASWPGGPNRSYGTASADTLSGSSAPDALYGYAGDDVLDGGRRADRLDGGLGADTLSGGTGKDTFVFNQLADSTREHLDVITDFSVTGDRLDLSALGIDHLGDGRDGSVALSYVAAEHRTYLTHLGADGTEDFRLALHGDFRTRLTDSKFVALHEGTAGNDILSWLGTTDAGLISGGDGDDVLEGGRGSGRLDGGAGADTLTGGGGADVFVYHEVTDSFVNDRTGVASVDRITDYDFGYGLVSGDRIDVSALGFTGIGDGHNGTLLFNLQDEVWSVQSLDADADGNRFCLTWTVHAVGLATGDVENALIFAPTATPIPQHFTWLGATEGKDVLTLSALYSGGDYDGLAGNDIITLATGDSVITGGLGRDTLAGGSGADTFRYTQLDDSYHGGNDLITDFNPTKDLIDVAALGYSGIGDGHNGTLLLAYSTDTDRTYLKDLDLNASGHRFEVGLSGNLVNAMDASSFLFADAAPEVTLLGASHSLDHALGSV